MREVGECVERRGRGECESGDPEGLPAECGRETAAVQ